MNFSLKLEQQEVVKEAMQHNVKFDEHQGIYSQTVATDTFIVRLIYINTFGEIRLICTHPSHL